MSRPEKDFCPVCDVECLSEWVESYSKWVDVRRYDCPDCGIIDQEYDSLAMDQAMEERSSSWPDE